MVFVIVIFLFSFFIIGFTLLLLITSILHMFFGAIEYIAINYRMYGEDFDIDETVNDIVNTIFRAYSKRKDFIK